MKRRRNATAEACDTAWRVLVLEQSRGRCYLCHRILPLEAHHIVFRSQSNDPSVRFDPDFGVGLCFDCHHFGPESPHVSNRRFLLAIEATMKVRQPKRWAKIGSIVSRPVPPFYGKADHAEILRSLREQFRLTRSLM